MFSSQPSRRNMASQGFAGICSVLLAFFCIGFLLMGSVFLGMSSASGIEDNPHFQSDFFKHERERSIAEKKIFRTVGIIGLSLSLTFFILAISLCCYVKKKMKAERGTQQRNANPLVSGARPPPAGFHVSGAGGAHPGGPYPMGPQPGYPTQPAQYPVYPSHTQPPQGAAYPPHGGAGYPPPSLGYPPPQQDFSPSTAAPSAPSPPAYSEVAGNAKF